MQGTSIPVLVQVLEGVQAAGQVIHSVPVAEGLLLSTVGNVMMRPLYWFSKGHASVLRTPVYTRRFVDQASVEPRYTNPP